MSPRPRGFTLLEVLVVLAIIGVIVGFATLATRDADPAALAEREAARLAQVLRLAGDESVMRGEELGLRFEDGAYAVLRLTEAGWAPVGDDPVFTTHRIEPPLQLRLYVDGAEVAPPADDATPPPQVLILSSGERTAFEVQFRAETTGWRLSAGGTGPAQLAPWATGAR